MVNERLYAYVKFLMSTGVSTKIAVITRCHGKYSRVSTREIQAAYLKAAKNWSKT